MKSKVIDFIIVALLLCSVAFMPGNYDVAKMVWEMLGVPTVVIDPGHGGIDGGAEGADGTAEKNINLDIALEVRDLLEEEGIKVIMTRTSDEGLYRDTGQEAIRTLKTQDMHERKRIMDESEASMVVSIHLNSFTQDDSVKGAQVFYPAAGNDEIIEESKLTAEIIQEELNESINVEKKRTALAKSDVFILKEATCPIVIVECGFLSNEDDLSKLKDKDYQEIISKTLKSSICKCFEEMSTR